MAAAENSKGTVPGGIVFRRRKHCPPRQQVRRGTSEKQSIVSGNSWHLRASTWSRTAENAWTASGAEP